MLQEQRDAQVQVCIPSLLAQEALSNVHASPFALLSPCRCSHWQSRLHQHAPVVHGKTHLLDVGAV